MRIKIILSLLIFAFSISCGNIRTYKMTLRVHGVVTDKADNSPIIGASVRLEIVGGGTLERTITDQNGYYYLEHTMSASLCPENRIGLLVKAETYRSDYSSVNFNPDVRCIESLQTINFQLQKKI